MARAKEQRQQKSYSASSYNNSNTDSSSSEILKPAPASLKDLDNDKLNNDDNEINGNVLGLFLTAQFSVNIRTIYVISRRKTKEKEGSNYFNWQQQTENTPKENHSR